MAIYTKTGDAGETGLVTNDPTKPVRITKNSLRIEAIGSIDELNSFLGVCMSVNPPQEVVGLLQTIQNNLFTIGSILAQAPLIFSHTETKNLETSIDTWEGSLPVLKNFILPGGSETGSLLHYARTLCRKAERRVVALHQKQPVDLEVLRYLNRLSDFLFTLARKINQSAQKQEIPWQAQR